MIGAKTADALDARKQQISSALFNNGEEQELEEASEVEYEDDEGVEEIEASVMIQKWSMSMMTQR